MRAFLTDLFDDEVYVFTPKGEVKTLPPGATPIDFAYAVHTDVGHRTVGAKINGRIVPLHYRLKNGDFVEILTSKAGRGPSRDWMSLAASSRARNKIRQWFSRETREDQEQKGRETLEQALKAAEAAVPQARRLGRARRGHPRHELQEGGGLLPRARLRASVGAQQVVNKVLQRLKTEQVAEEEAVPAQGAAREARGRRARTTASTSTASTTCSSGSRGAARRCRATRSSATSRSARASRSTAATVRTCKALARNPERFTPVELGRRRLAELPRPDRGRLVGPAAAARGRRADVRRARREHRLVRRHRRGSDGAGTGTSPRSAT